MSGSAITPVEAFASNWPGALAIGTDIIECQRIARIMDRHGEVFLRRVFTPREIDYCQSRGKMAYQHYAARWAAKEAVLKVLGTGWAAGIQWTDVELCNQDSGRPMIMLYQQASQISDKLGFGQIMISISHTQQFAIAFAAAMKATVCSAST
ncbi:MAG: holo-ACP synthase [Pirellulaceae bacterium]|nr:holo-ACP synthase [Pirellulaceae bacterium]